MAGTKPEELIKWAFDLAELFELDLGEYQTMTDYEGQIQEWACHGCDAIGHAEWPKWEVKIAHSPDCKWQQFKAIAEANQ